MTSTASIPVVSPHDDHDAAALAKRNRLVIGLLLVSAFVVILNETTMGVAIPHLVGDLGITIGAAQWLSTAFLLTMAIVIPITGFLLQRYNTRPVFIAAMTLFSLGTLIAAASPGFELLLVARVIQASGTAIMMPLLFTTVLNLVPPASRGRVIGNVSIVISVAPALGPTISGFILNYLEWRWIFILVLPIALAALAIGARLMVNVTEPSSARIDVLSIILAAFGFGGLVYGLSNLGTEYALAGIIALAIGVVGLAVFIWRQLRLQRTDAALLDLRTFLSRDFSFSIGTVAISMIALFGTIILLPIYMQDVLGLKPIETGLVLLPGGLLMGLLAPIVGRIFDRFGPRILLVPGAIVVSASLWGMTMLDAASPVWWVIAAHVVLSLGLALLFTPLFTAGLASLTPKLYSHGSAIVGTVQQVAGAAGTALFVAIMTVGTTSAVAAGTPLDEATAAGIRTAFTIGAIISVFAIPAVFFIRRPVEDPNAEWQPSH